MVREPESAEECEYFSRRSADENGNKCMIWVFKETPTEMNIRYVCGKCGNEGTVSDEYGLPYTFECQGCGEIIKVEPLKGKKKGAKKRR